MLGNVEGNIFNTTLQSPLLTVKLVSQQVKTERKRGSNYRVQKSFINFNIVKNIFCKAQKRGGELEKQGL